MSTDTASSSGSSLAERLLTFRAIQKAMMFLLLFVLCAVAAVEAENFLTWENIVANIFRNAAPMGIIAIGMTFVMVAGGFDLSVASTTVVGTVVTVLTLNGLLPHGLWVAVPGAILVTCLVCMVLGAANGILIAYVRVNPFVTTLSTMLIFRSFAMIFTGGGQMTQLQMDGYQALKHIYFGQFPLLGSSYQMNVPLLIFIIALIIGVYLLWFTRYGHYIYAIGGNEEAARLAGIPTQLIVASTYTLLGLCCAIAAIILVAQTTAAQPEGLVAKELDVIASVIVGGTPLGGGAGGLGSTLLGICLLQVIENLLTQFNIGAEYRPLLTGVIIATMVTIDTVFKKKH